MASTRHPSPEEKRFSKESGENKSFHNAKLNPSIAFYLPSRYAFQ